MNLEVRRWFDNIPNYYFGDGSTRDKLKVEWNEKDAIYVMRIN